jgi:hypothetical protein
VVFAGGFGEKCDLDVVFLWTTCGELRGKRGAKTAYFCGPKTGHLFEVYF